MDEKAMASDPATSPAKLRRLANNPALRHLVAANPNTPMDLLLGMMKRHPEAVLSNPTFSLALLADLSLVDRLSKDAIVALAGVPSLSPELVRVLFKRGGSRVFEALAGNDATPPELLEQLLLMGDPTVREKALARPALPPRWAALVRKAMAGVHDGGPRLDDDEVARLLEAGQWARWLLTQQSQLHEGIEARFVASNSHHLIEGLISRHGARLVLPQELLDYFLSTRHASYLVHNPAVGPQRWYELLVGGPELLDPLLSAPVADEVVRRVMQNGHPELRTLLAANAKSPAFCLRELAHDPSLRLAVAANTGAPAEALQLLASDLTREVRLAVASNVSAPPAALDVLGADPVTRVRQRVAANASAPPGVLGRLASDGEMAVRIVVARNPALPPDALDALASDGDERVRDQVAARRRGDKGYPAWTPAC